MRRHLLLATLVIALFVVPIKAVCFPDNGCQKASFGLGEAPFTVAVPAHWVVNQTEDLPDGFIAEINPEGQHWRTASKYILVTVYSNNQEKSTRFETLVSQDSASLKKNSSSSLVSRKRSVMTKSEKAALINQVVDRSEKSWQAMAYIKENRSVILLILSCDNEGEFKNTWLTFRRVVASYQSGKGTK